MGGVYLTRNGYIVLIHRHDNFNGYYWGYTSWLNCPFQPNGTMYKGNTPELDLVQELSIEPTVLRGEQSDLSE